MFEEMKERWCRTDRVVFEHAQRLVRTRSLHGPVVACHGHGYQAHHNGTGLCCEVPLSAQVDKDVRCGRPHWGSAGVV